MTYSFEQFMNALRVVETGGTPKKGQGVIGDNGKARGPYQIWRVYYIDAAKYLERDSCSLMAPCTYEDCDYLKPAGLIVWLYMQRYAKKALLAGDWERCARIHNGGPYGYRKKSTVPYWEKVKSTLEDIYGKTSIS